MMISRTRRGLPALVIAALAGAALLTGRTAVFGQEKPDAAAKAQPADRAQPAAELKPAQQELRPPAAQPVAVQPTAAQPIAVHADQAHLRATPAQTPGFVGPPEPRSPAAQPQLVGQAGVSKPAGSDIPAPTVVLQPGEAPAIVFDTPTWDWGRIQSGPDIAHDFWFTNTGNGPLEILKVRPG